MQQYSLRIKSYRSFKIDDRVYSKIAKKRYQQLLNFEKLVKDGCTEAVALEVIGVSRSTFYRHKLKYKERGLLGLEPASKKPKNIRRPTWDKNLEGLVLKLRKQEPVWGKIKIHKLITRDYGINVSEAMVGRIISKLLANNKIKPTYLAANKDKPKRKRVFNKHASRWKYGMRGQNPGEMVQIDHMSVYSNSRCIKHFKAVCPVSRFMVCDVYNTASSRSASKFLRKLIQDAPFKISSIQVDGGSEFMKEFEKLCSELDIKLYVLPPKSPKYNGKVERCNGITRDEFYSQYGDIFEIDNIRPYLNSYQNKYNTYRPHQGLNNLTPLEYIDLANQNIAA